MVAITVEAYQNARVHTITVKNKDKKMIDVQNKLGVKPTSNLLPKEMQGKFGTKNLTEDQKRMYKKTEYEITKNSKESKRDKFAKNDIMEKIIKNCGGVKRCNDGVDRLDKENQRENFRQLLGFKENEVYESKEYSIIKKDKENI